MQRAILAVRFSEGTTTIDFLECWTFGSSVSRWMPGELLLVMGVVWTGLKCCEMVERT